MADKHTRFVLGCKARREESTSLHFLPKDPKIREQWMNFLFRNHCGPVKVSDKTTQVCCNHFQEDCFANFVQKKMGFATVFKLKPDAVPSVLPGDTSSQHVGQPVTISVSLFLLPGVTTSVAVA